jgi:hypothetical protein
VAVTISTQIIKNKPQNHTTYRYKSRNWFMKNDELGADDKITETRKTKLT